MKKNLPSLSKQTNENLGKVLTLIQRPELVSTIADLVNIASVNPPGEEGKVARFLGAKMEECDLEVRYEDVFPGRPNVYGTLRGEQNSPVLVLNGHTDVVPAGEGWVRKPFEATVESDKIYGRGTADMKGAIGAMLIAAKALASSKVKLKGSLVIAGTVDEEVNSAGTRLLAAKNFKADYAVVGEPTQLKICIAHKGDVTYEITTQGKAAHSSMPEKGISAITKMTKVIAAIENYGTDLKKKRHKLLGHPTVSVGTIQGGVTTWAVPDFCKITVDRRTLPGENADSVQKELQGILNELKQNDSEFAASMKLMTDMGFMEVSEDDQIVRAFREAAATISRTDRGIHFAPYTCDATFFVNQMKTPTVIYGPGDIAQAHKPDEFVSIDECVEAARVYATASVKLLS